MPLTDAIVVDDVSKWFGPVTALDRVNLAVAPGTVHGLVGANGAGKSTLLSVLFGLVRPDEGQVWLFGRTQHDAGAAWLDGVGGFIESPKFYPYLTGRSNLRALANLDGGDATALIDQALDVVGLVGAGAQKVRGYSLGMRQRLALAAAMIRRPRLLILDEPANGLDPAGIHGLREMLRTLAGQGVSVLFSSHDIAQVDELCDAVTVLHRGAVVFSGSAERLRADAPDAVWRARTSDDAVAVRLAAELGIDQTSAAGDGLRLSGDQLALDRWTVALGRAGVAVRTLEQESSALQTLMLRLIGGSPEPSSSSSVLGGVDHEPVAGAR